MQAYFLELLATKNPEPFDSGFFIIVIDSRNILVEDITNTNLSLPS